MTGSAGFVGRHMAAELERRGYIVHGWDIENGRDAFHLFAGAADRPLHFDLIVHAAASAPHRAAIDTEPMHMAYNLRLDAAMFDWAVRTGQGRVVYLSSCAVLDGPDDYGWTKLTGERQAGAARRAGLPVTVVRPYSGYGEDQGEDWPFGAFAARARRREDPFVIWGDGSQVRDWIHIDDVVNGALAVADSGTEEPVSLCTGIGTSMETLAQRICAAAGHQPRGFWFANHKPAGVPYRVGDPSTMLRYHTPQVSLKDGVRRALAVADAR